MTWAMVALLTLPLVLTSCEKDDDVKDASLVNTWEASESTSFLGVSIEFTTKYVFNADKTGTMTITSSAAGEEDSEILEFTYVDKTDSVEVTYTEFGQELSEVWGYSISGNSLTLTIDEVPMVLKKK